LDKPVDPHTVLLGEVGLTGEVRAVSRTDIRVSEAAKLGFRRCLLPQSNAERLRAIMSIQIIGVQSVQAVLDILF
jgi:DNA repair protein RadA/Sms